MTALKQGFLVRDFRLSITLLTACCDFSSGCQFRYSNDCVNFSKAALVLAHNEMRHSSAVTTCSTLLPQEDQYPIQTTLAFANNHLTDWITCPKNLSHLNCLCLVSGLMRCLYDNTHSRRHHHLHHHHYSREFCTFTAWCQPFHFVKLFLCGLWICCYCKV